MTAFGDALEDVRYLRKRGFEVLHAGGGDSIRVGKKWLSLDEVKAMATRERQLDNGVDGERKPESIRPELTTPVVPSLSRDLSPAGDERKIPRQARDDRRARSDATRDKSRQVECSLADKIVGLVVVGLRDVGDDVGEHLISEAVECLHAAGSLIAVLPCAASRAAVVRELKRFLPEIVEQRAGELHRGGLR